MSEQITTPEALEALPAGAVVRSDAGTIAARHTNGRGVCFGVEASFPWDHLALPAKVLFRPDTPTPTPAGLTVTTEQIQAARVAARAERHSQIDTMTDGHIEDDADGITDAVLTALGIEVSS